jgi:hypothetical protein
MQALTTAEFETYVRNRHSPQLLKWVDLPITQQTLSELAESNIPCYLHEGDLTFTGHWQPLDALTLITGDVTVHGLLDARPSQEGYDSWGDLLIFGNVTCENFSSSDYHHIMILGDLMVEKVLLNSFMKSALTVYGNLKARYFHGLDIWANVGGQVEIEHCNGTIFSTENLFEYPKPMPLLMAHDAHAKEAVEGDATLDSIYQRLVAGLPILKN